VAGPHDNRKEPAIRPALLESTRCEGGTRAARVKTRGAVVLKSRSAGWGRAHQAVVLPSATAHGAESQDDPGLYN